MDFSLAVPRLPRVGETVVASGMRVSHGGKGANQAIFLARLGARVELVSRVGDDEFGRSFRAALAREGVGCEAVGVDPEAPTALGIPMVVGGDANAIVVALGAAMRLDEAAVRGAAAGIAASRALLAQLEVPLPAFRAAAEMARAAGVPVFLNAAPAVPGAAAACALADVLIVNEEEAQALAGAPMSEELESVAAVAQALGRLGPRVVVVTLGRRGALVAVTPATPSTPSTPSNIAGSAGLAGATLDMTAPRLVPGFRVEAVDPTGAGDAFCAGLVRARLDGAGWPAAVEMGNACGALAATGLGAVAAQVDGARAAALVASGERLYSDG